MAAFKLNLADLQFVLKQIKIGEANSTAHSGAAAVELTAIYVDANGNPVPAGTPGATLAIPDPHVPAGIRTVDGSYNNLVPGREFWGAAAQPMPYLLEQNGHLNEGDDSISFGSAQNPIVFGNNNYAPGTASNTPGVQNGSVVDADPRTISNLIVDMSANNPAALMAALTFAGAENPLGALQELLASRVAPDLVALQTAVDDATAALDVAIGAYTPGNAAALDAIQDAAEALSAAETALTAAEAAGTPDQAFMAKATELGLEFDQTGSLVIPNVAPDEGLSAPFNSWMTFFGQFFDHGLDLISKGGNGTIYIPLQPDDPLYNPNSPNTNLMVLTRSTPVADGQGGTSQQNVTTSWVDQNQTYTSHASHQVFLREYKFSVDGPDADTTPDSRPVATGKLLDGTGPNGEKNGLPTWADVKKQAADVLGIRLTGADVGQVPVILTDAYGEFIRGPNGLPQILAAVRDDGTPIYVEGNLANPLNPSAIQLPVGTVLLGGNVITDGETVSAARTPNAFLDDIAHAAQQVNSRGQALRSDLDDDLGITTVLNPNFVPLSERTAENPAWGNPPPPAYKLATQEFVVVNPAYTGSNESASNAQFLSASTFFDNELLDAHFITGDGRGNENFGLTAVHHVFHSEHNRQIDDQKLTILRSGDLNFVNEWMTADISEPELTAFLNGYDAAVNKGAYLANSALFTDGGWDGERLFQAGRMATEMQYQHLVFEEFGRKVQPAIDVFVFNAVTDIDASIFSEFANVVYRFGHSMLTDSMPRVHLNADGSIKSEDDMGLIAAFLNPLNFNNVDFDGAGADGSVQITAEQAAGAIVRGMTTERGNEIDEFVTGALRNTLLGIPLDLAAINIARGRDTNMPTLNEAREQLYAASNSTFLKPYESWTDFASNLKNPMSVVNFIAAYGTHSSITSVTSMADKRDAAWLLVFGGEDEPADRLDFINARGAYAPDGTGTNDDSRGGLNNIDLWIGGLAEKKMPFGGFLGSTFNAVFELQMENLQDGDRFYYLTRTQGQNFLNSLEQNSFAKMIMANTDIASAGADGIRGTADDVVDRHIGVDSFATYDYVFEVDQTKQADYNPDDATSVDPTDSDPTLVALGLTKVIRDDPATAGADARYFRTFGGEHVVVGGTHLDDTIITDFGDDGIWGDMGNDRIESGAGVDLVNGGAGNDIITDSGDSGDFIKGDEGDDVIANSNGLDILMGGTGKDAIFVGVDATEVFAGDGNDFVLGGADVDLLMGNEGDDWLEGGDGFDTTAGDNSELFFNSAIIGHDVMFAGSDEHDFDAESGDDIMVQGESVMRNEGMFGFDWAIFKGMALDGYADMRIPIFTTEQEDTLRNRFDKTEALSGWNKNDTLIGDDRVFGEIAPGDTVATTENIFFNDGLNQAGIDRIAGFDEIVAVGASGFFESGNILLGGGGSDNLRGNGGDDILDGDRWLNVRISIRQNADGTGPEIATVDSMKHVFAAGQTDSEGQAIPAAWHGKSLFELMIARVITPTQMHITREILETGVGATDVDTAFYNDSFLAADGTANYTIVENADGSVTVSHVNVTVGAIDPLTERNLVSDGVDTLRNIELLQFADRTISLIKPTLELNGFDPITRSWGDNFSTRAYTNNDATATEDFNGAWAEAGDAGGATGGSVQITTGGTLTFSQGNADDASVTRTLNLQGAASATVTFSINDTGVGGFLSNDNEEIFFEFAADGTNFVTLRTFDGDNGGNISVTLPTNVPFGDAAAIRFRANNILDAAGFLQAAESFSVDNLTVSAVFQQPAAAPSIDITTSFVENAAATPIASDPRITDDGQTLASARIVLTNMFPGDTFVVPAALTAANAPIAATTQTIGSTLVVTLTGVASIAAYLAAIQSLGYRNLSEDPDTTPRVIEVSVNDGFFNSNVARTTVNVTAVNDPVNANNDTVISNSTTLPIAIPEWALLANDIDPDDPLAMTGITAVNGIAVTRTGGNIFVTTDTGAAGGSFTYRDSDGPTADTAVATLQRATGQNITGGNGAEIIVGDSRASTILANGGNDIIFTGAGNDIVGTGTGADTLVWNVGDGQDRFDGGADEDTVRIDGNADNEAFVVYSRASAIANGIGGLNAATEIVITRNGALIAELDNIEEIVINTGDGTDSVTTLGTFAGTSLNFNTITIDGGAGNDTVDITGLQSAHRILFRSFGGDDTIVGTLRPQDVVELVPGEDLSSYVLSENANGTKTFSNGTHSITFTGAVPQFDNTPSTGGSHDGGGSGGSTGSPAAGFAVTASDLAALKNLVNGIGMDGGAGGVRTLGGDGNNVDNPAWGSADQPFIRLTEARYGEYDASTGNRAINPIFDGLDPRAISNIIGDQEAGLPKAQSETNIFFMAFGQYFDHGLDFLPKGGNGVIEIGGPGAERAPGTDNPADLTRGTVAFIDADGIPQHLNKTSPFVDQNQAYGSHSLVGQFLRESDGNGGVGSHLLAGAPDPSAPEFKLLPTLRELIQHHWDADTIFRDPSLPDGAISFRDYFSNFPITEDRSGSLFNSAGAYDPEAVSSFASNFMGSGHALLLDTNPFQNLLDHYVAGDGRANENFGLTAMHTVWARNHNFHVENLEAAGFEGTQEELFQAAKILNEAEYARVVFDEFADALIGGMRGSGTHGDSGYNPEANAGISHEFAAAVYRLGHSLVGQTMTVLDENGQPKQVALFDAFLNPSNDAGTYTAPLPPGYVPQPGYAQLGVGNILGGIVTQQAEEVDVNIVDAIRSDLVRINADLFSFNVARSWDVGLGTLNQIRMGLQASQDPYVREAIGFAGDLTPYASWEDFQTRNGLSDTVISQFKQAYPDLVLQDAAQIAAFQAINPDIELVDGNIVKGIDRVDPWVGGLAEKHINGGMVGQTFWVVLHEQLDRLQEGDRFYYTDRLDNLDLYENIIDGQEFSDIVMRNTGLTGLAEKIFFVDDEDDGANEQPGDGHSNPIPGTGTGTGTGDDDEDEDDDGAPTTGGGNDDDDEDADEDEDDEDVDLPPTGGSGDDEEDDEDEGPTPAPSPGSGTPVAPRVGTVNADVLVGSALAEDFVAFAGDDVITAGDGDDTVAAGEGADFIRAGSGRDMVFAGTGDDQVFAEDGNDMVYGEAGNDRIFAGGGNDLVDAGSGDDTVFGGAGSDLFLASIGDGNDTYYGDDQDGGAGVDTLDMSAILANAMVDLGTGSRGSATSAQSGTDILWSIENVITGAGNDTITAGVGVNVLDGGDGNDTFRFESVAAINGDRILGFEPGDKIDLSGIDANYGSVGDQAFTIASGTALTAAGQLTVTYETTPNGEITVVKGNVDATTDADFRLEIQGHHTLTNQNFGL